MASTSAADWTSKSGDFERPDSAFRKWVRDEQTSQYPAEKGRYHLYLAYSCPWAHRILILREMKGLQDIISYTAMHWLQDDKGWKFATDAERDNALHMTPDPYEPNFTHLRDIYLKEEPNYKGRYTTPTLYDTKSKTIVNNESADVLRMLNKAFNGLLPEDKKKIDLYPQGHKCEIDLANAWIYEDLNNGVYRTGFATKQAAYEKAAKAVFVALDRVEAQLQDFDVKERPYFFGSDLTETDVRIFTTAVRFDPVYVQHFKVNIRDIRHDYPAIHKWMRNLYWNHEAFRTTTNFEHIKKNYTQSQLHVNPTGITPLGPVPNILPLDAGIKKHKTASNAIHNKI